jgi:hypothetical protein
VRGLVNTPPFLVAQRSEVLWAVDSYEEGGAEFPDYLILELSRTEGASTVLTFDRRLLRHSAHRLANQLQTIYDKLGVGSRRELVAILLGSPRGKP